MSERVDWPDPFWMKIKREKDAQIVALREENAKLREELAAAHYSITRWSRASQVVGNHRSCSCAVCDALYDAAEAITDRKATVEQGEWRSNHE